MKNSSKKSSSVFRVAQLLAPNKDYQRYSEARYITVRKLRRLTELSHRRYLCYSDDAKFILSNDLFSDILAFYEYAGSRGWDTERVSATIAHRLNAGLQKAKQCKN